MPDKEPTEEEHRSSVREKINLMSISQVGLFVLAASYTIYLIRPVLLPIILALLLTLVFKPVQRRLQAYLRLPAPLAALVVMLAALAAGVFAVASLSQPAIKYAAELRGDKVKERLVRMVKPISDVKKEITEVAAEVQKMTEPETPEETREEGAVDVSVTSENRKATPGSPEKKNVSVEVNTDDGDVAIDSSENNIEVESSAPPVKVQITSNEDPAKPLYTFASHVTVDFFAIMALLFFFLAYGDEMIRRMAEVDAAANLMEELTQDVSYYLFSITVINVSLGIAIGVAMWLLGMPNPVLWGAMAALLNYIPYLGAIAGTAIVFIVATANFELTRQTIPIPIAYYLLTAIEGNFITPAVIGRKFTINPIIVFAWVFCWGVMWGIPGMLIGLPLLMMFRIVCAKLPSLARLERVISI